MEKLTLTVKEAAAVLGISLPIMYSLTEQKDFYPLIRVGRKKLVLRRKFEQWLDEQTGQRPTN